MPSTTSSSLSRPEPSSTVITPSLPTLSIACAMVLPMDSSEFAEIVPTCAMALLSLQAFEDDGLSENGGSGRAIAGFIRGVGSDFLHQLRAHVLELVLELDLLGNGHAVLGDRRRAEALLEHGIAALGTQRRLDGIGQDIDAAEHLHAGVVTETYVFSSHDYLPSMMAMTSSSRMTRSSSPSTFTSVPPYLPNRTLSPTFTSSARTDPSSRILPLPTAMTLPWMGFSVAVSGMMIPPAEVRSSSSRFTRMRSW